MNKRFRNPQVNKLPVTFEANIQGKYIVAIFQVGGTAAAPNSKDSTIGIRFVSPEHMLQFFTAMMENAVIVWPDNEWIKEFLRP